MRLIKQIVVTAALLGVATAARSTSPDIVRNPYLNYSCGDLIKAATQTSAQADRTAGIQSKDVKSDPAGDPVVVWSKAFLAKVSGSKGEELSHLKEQMISIEQAAVEAQCQIQFDGQRPPGV